METEREALLKLAVTGTPFAVALSVAGRFVARRFLHREQRDGRLVRRVVVAGSAAAASQLIRRLANESGLRHDRRRRLRPRRRAGRPRRPRRCRSSATCATSAPRSRSSAATPSRSPATTPPATPTCASSPGPSRAAGSRCSSTPVSSRSPGRGCTSVRSSASRCSTSRSRTSPGRAGWSSATTDIVLTAFGLVVISPVMLLVALAIKLQDGGPVIFAQTRIGRGGDEFTMYKFRSMRTGAENELASLMERNQGKGGLFKLERRPAHHPPRSVPAELLPRRAAAAAERPQRHDVAGRPPSAPRARAGAHAGPLEPARAGHAGPHRPLAGQRPLRTSRATPRSSSTCATSRTGPSPSTC